MRRKECSLSWCRICAKAVSPDCPGHGTIWIMEDVGEDRAIREALEQSTRELVGIFETNLIGIAVVRFRKIVRNNLCLEQLFLAEPGSLVNRGVADIMAKNSNTDGLVDGVYHDLEISRGHHAELKLVRDDGSEFWARISGRAFDQAHPEAGSAWLVEDITQRHEAEHALMRANSEMEQRVNERTAELAAANAQLQEEIFERMQTEQRVWHLAHHDTLTGLPNRALLQDRLDQALTQAGRHDSRVAVMFLDLDRFKSINDTLGHSVGDELLKRVAERLRAGVRSMDTVSRLGGDEFVVLLHEVGIPEDVVMVAEKVLASLAPVLHVNGHALHVTPSIGISVYPDDGTDAMQLMKNADTAMYHAKAAGRNNFQFFAAHMNDAATRFFNLEQRLRRAIENKELLLHYQPLVDFDLQAVCGLEALVRWNDPEHGMISPGEFIPVAEETGLIVPMGQWMIATACREILELTRELGYGLRLAVNISAREIVSPSFLDDLRAILERTGMPAHWLELEITESIAMHDITKTATLLKNVSALGMTIAIDDFGTGHSSLAYLKQLPVDYLKIDRTFVRDIPGDKEDSAIVRTIITMSRTLDVQVIAEGVETEEQLEFLRQEGCDLAQGYYLSKPIAIADLKAFLRQHDAG